MHAAARTGWLQEEQHVVLDATAGQYSFLVVLQQDNMFLLQPHCNLMMP